jgi:hypothetical protein
MERLCTTHVRAVYGPCENTCCLNLWFEGLGRIALHNFSDISWCRLASWQAKVATSPALTDARHLAFSLRQHLVALLAGGAIAADNRSHPKDILFLNLVWPSLRPCKNLTETAGTTTKAQRIIDESCAETDEETMA